MSSRQKNEVIFFRDTRLKNVELRFSEYRQHAFEKHTHDAFSIGLIKRGNTEFYYQNHSETAGKGDIVLINPGLVHACNPVKGSAFTYYMLYIQNDRLQEIGQSLFGKKGKNPIFSKPVVRNLFLYRELTILTRLLKDSPAELETESLLVETLAVILQNYGQLRKTVDLPAPGCSENIKRGQAYLLENLFQNISLEELSRHSGLSPYHFLREFRKQYGLPPHAFQLQERVNAAKRLLAEGQPIARVAAETGFSDQSHFTRKFKSFVGATPRQYQSGNH